MAARSPIEPVGVGYDVDENAVRFSNYFHVLRELVHLSCGWLPLEPRLEPEYLLCDHLHDDARAVTKIKRRLYELRTPSDYPGAPCDDLAALLDRASSAQSSAEYLAIASGEPKPALIAAVRIHLDQLDPLLDEPSLRQLTQLLHRQERHVAELPAPTTQPSFDDLGALPIRLREVRDLTVMPLLDQPARDGYVEVTAEGDPYLTDELYVNGDENHVPTDPEEQKHFFHGLMDAELCAAELMARNSHEHPEMPWDFHVDMARQTWDEIRHAEVLDRLMTTELGCHWGDYPVSFDEFRAIYALDLAGRLARLDGEPASDRDSEVLDYLAADKVAHAETAKRWG